MDNLRQQIQKLEQENQEGLAKAERLSKEEAEAVARQRVYEELKFDQFKRIIEGERYFRIEHFKKLGINYHIAIHLSAKNIGKTTELYRLINECLNRGKKFIYGRVTPQELETEVDKFREDKLSPVIMLKYGTKYYYFRKRDVKEYHELYPDTDGVTYSKLTKAGYQVVGKGMTFMGSNVLGSGNYEDYDLMLFDEIVSYTPKQYVNERILYNWGVAVSTILRNKSNLTIIMMGNLQNNVTSVPVLQYYGIDVSDNLRVVERSIGDGEPCRILYINSGSLYNNALKNQASVAHHASLDDRLFMEHNKIINTSHRVLNRAIIEKMKPMLACAMEWVPDELYVLELRSYDYIDDKLQKVTDYALCVHKMTVTTTLDIPIYTHDPFVANKFSKVTYIGNSILSMFRCMYKLFVSRLLYYDSSNSLEIGARCLQDVVCKFIDSMDYGRGR